MEKIKRKCWLLKKNGGCKMVKDVSGYSSQFEHYLNKTFKKRISQWIFMWYVHSHIINWYEILSTLYEHILKMSCVTLFVRANYFFFELYFIIQMSNNFVRYIFSNNFWNKFWFYYLNIVNCTTNESFLSPRYPS